jgi:membrane protein implicated in regulation of membrane protease activity
MSVSLTVNVLLALAAFIIGVMSAMGKAPLWLAVILLAVMELLKVLPGGH